MLNFDFPETPEHYEEHYEEDYEKEAELLHRCNINYIHNETGSTHSSMPDLIYDDVASTHSSMPELIDDVSSLESEERIRNSFELCGNE